MRKKITSQVDILRDIRVKQLEGMFDVPPSERSVMTWDVHLPVEDNPWQIGLIVGPSGCGKSTVAREFFGDQLVSGYSWDPAASIVSCFPKALSIKEICAALSSVGFSSPPSWLRPFGALSNGEQFRVTLARAICESEQMFVIDEFTSVVDRSVAQVGCAAVSKAIRKGPKQMVAVACHYDIVDWLQPDWIYEPATNTFTWRSLRRRPDIVLTVRKVDKAAWDIFKRHHYLDTTMPNHAQCFVAFLGNQPVCWYSVVHFPHPSAPSWRGHRAVCLPDFQGVGIGNAVQDYIASLYRAKGKPFTGVSSNPAMIAYVARSPKWKITREPSMATRQSLHGGTVANSAGRRTCSFRFTGAANRTDAQGFGIVPASP